MKKIILILMFILLSIIVIAYDAPSNTNVDLVLDAGYTPPNSLAVNLVLGDVGVSSLGIDWVTPTSSGNHTNFTFKEYTVQVCCFGDNCGEVNVSLDPMIQLKDNGTENLEDASFDEDHSLDGTEVGIVIDHIDGTGEVGFHKWNISFIPSGATINNVSFCFTSTLGAPVENATMDIWYVDNQTWVEGEIDDLCGDGIACDAVWSMLTSKIRNFSLNGTQSQEECFDGLESTVQTEVDAGNTNVSFAFNLSDAKGNASINFFQWSSKEGINISMRPYLNITYDAPPTFTDLVNITIEGGNDLDVDFNATDDVAFDCFSINDSNFKINCTGYFQNDTSLSISIYDINITINDTGGREQSSIIWVNVIEIPKGLINTTTGATPFYTNGSNPQNIASLNQDACQNMTWYVNATGEVNGSYNFFAYANLTSDMTINNVTSTIEINITEPVVAPPGVTPCSDDHPVNCTFPNSFSIDKEINCSCNCNTSTDSYARNISIVGGLADNDQYWNITATVSFYNITPMPSSCTGYISSGGYMNQTY